MLIITQDLVLNIQPPVPLGHYPIVEGREVPPKLVGFDHMFSYKWACIPDSPGNILLVRTPKGGGGGDGGIPSK